MHLAHKVSALLDAVVEQPVWWSLHRPMKAKPSALKA
jgi:hypothetical protein